jgi:CubicO group peptidase (beta-lactamase class C family)
MSARNVLFSLSVLCCVLFTCHGTIEDEIRTTIQDAYKGCRQSKNPGLVVSVVKDGATVLNEAYGVKDKISQEAVTTDTLFGLGGLSAIFADILITKKNADYDRYEYNFTVIYLILLQNF